MRAVGSFFVSIYRNKSSFVGFLILMMFVFFATVGPEIIPIREFGFSGR